MARVKHFDETCQGEGLTSRLVAELEIFWEGFSHKYRPSKRVSFNAWVESWIKLADRAKASRISSSFAD